MYYTIKINFPGKTWVRTDEPEDQESSKGRGRGGEKKYGRGDRIDDKPGKNGGKMEPVTGWSL